MGQIITLLIDGKIPLTVDSEEFEIIKLMVEEAGGKESLEKLRGPVNELVVQGYTKMRAISLCNLARHQLLDARYD